MLHPRSQRAAGSLSAHCRGLGSQHLPFTVPLRLSGAWYPNARPMAPAVKLEWVEGQTLNRFVEDRWRSQAAPAVARSLAQGCRPAPSRRYRPCRPPARQRSLGPRYGKLAVKLIDYDGMYIPPWRARQSGELGHPDYQHPLRLQHRVAQRRLHRFRTFVIYCEVDSLLSASRDFWQRFNNDETCCFGNRISNVPSGPDFSTALGGGRRQRAVRWSAASCRLPRAVGSDPVAGPIVEEGLCEGIDAC